MLSLLQPLCGTPLLHVHMPHPPPRSSRRGTGSCGPGGSPAQSLSQLASSVWGPPPSFLQAGSCPAVPEGAEAWLSWPPSLTHRPAPGSSAQTHPLPPPKAKATPSPWDWSARPPEAPGTQSADSSGVGGLRCAPALSGFRGREL